jgi:Tol biopolymer transport system component
MRVMMSSLLVSGLLVLVAMAAYAGVTTRVSVASDGTQANDSNGYPAISADGRYVAFDSAADNLVPGDTNGAIDVFVHDRQTGQTTRVSVSSDGAQGNSWSDSPSISADGRCVAFFSDASNLVPGDTNGQTDSFVHDRQTGETTRVSVASDGTQGNALFCTISGDGRYVAFWSGASDLAPGDTNGQIDCFVHDRQTGATTRVSVASDGAQGDSESINCSISRDGRYVAFTSLASNFAPDDTDWWSDVYVHDRQTGLTSRVSVGNDGAQGNSYCTGPPSISGDDRYIAFTSYASNLVAGDTNNTKDVFVRDLQTGRTTRVSVDSNGAQANSYSMEPPSISDDGRYVAFFSDASNLVPGDTNGRHDVFVYERQMCITSETQICLPVSGWHIIAQPASGDHALSACSVRNNATGETLTFCEATSPQHAWIDSVLYRWDPALRGYVACTCSPAPGQEDLLIWGHGYWVYAYLDDLALLVF